MQMASQSPVASSGQAVLPSSEARQPAEAGVPESGGRGVGEGRQGSWGGQPRTQGQAWRLGRRGWVSLRVPGSGNIRTEVSPIGRI